MRQGSAPGRADAAADPAGRRCRPADLRLWEQCYQVAQGGRYFLWYGCSGCHTEVAAGVLRLADGRWKYGGGFADVFGAIADHHGRLPYGRRVPVEQIWQLAAYVRDLSQHTPEKRRRTSLDEAAEPRGARWPGPQ